jgi:hypothetical protein
MKSSRLIGTLFLLGFVSYGVGAAVVSTITGRPGFLATIAAHQTTLIIGALLMLLNSAVDVGKGVLFFPILEHHSRRTAFAYLSAMTVEVVLLAVGVLCILMTVPLGSHAGEGWARGVGSLLVQANTMAYQIAEMSLCTGGILLCSVLFRARLVPRFLAGWGLAGYPIFLAGTVAEIFGIHVGVLLAIPGGLFEVAIGIWLLAKGFPRSADGTAWILQSGFGSMPSRGAATAPAGFTGGM